MAVSNMIQNTEHILCVSGVHECTVSCLSENDASTMLVEQSASKYHSASVGPGGKIKEGRYTVLLFMFNK